MSKRSIIFHDFFHGTILGISNKSAFRCQDFHNKYEDKTDYLIFKKKNESLFYIQSTHINQISDFLPFTKWKKKKKKKKDNIFSHDEKV